MLAWGIQNGPLNVPRRQLLQGLVAGWRLAACATTLYKYVHDLETAYLFLPIGCSAMAPFVINTTVHTSVPQVPNLPVQQAPLLATAQIILVVLYLFCFDTRF